MGARRGRDEIEMDTNVTVQEEDTEIGRGVIRRVHG